MVSDIVQNASIQNLSLSTNLDQHQALFDAKTGFLYRNQEEVFYGSDWTVLYFTVQDQPYNFYQIQASKISINKTRNAVNKPAEAVNKGGH